MLSSVVGILEDIGDKDCYDNISASSTARGLARDTYSTIYKVGVPALRCMITGISQNSITEAMGLQKSPPKNPVVVSHLLPRSANIKERLSLGYRQADIDSIRNSILLCKGIEEAFDHKFISFVPTETPFSGNRYKLHIWVERIKTEPIYEGAQQTIGDYDGSVLSFAVGSFTHNPFNRALSFQAYRAFRTWAKDFGLKTLPEDSNTSIYEGSYKQKRIAYAQQLARDVASDAEEEDGGEEGGIDEESVGGEGGSSWGRGRVGGGEEPGTGKEGRGGERGATKNGRGGRRRRKGKGKGRKKTATRDGDESNRGGGGEAATAGGAGTTRTKNGGSHPL